MKDERGAILLFLMLVITGASLAALLALSLGGIDAFRTAVEEEGVFEEQAVVFGCFDELLIQLVGDPDFTTTSISIGSTSCDVLITNLGGTSRAITITRTNQNITRRLEVDLTVDPVVVTAVREEM